MPKNTIKKVQNWHRDALALVTQGQSAAKKEDMAGLQKALDALTRLLRESDAAYGDDDPRAEGEGGADELHDFLSDEIGRLEDEMADLKRMRRGFSG